MTRGSASSDDNKYIQRHPTFMCPMLIDGKKFEGPMVLGKDAIPNVPAIALICTEAGEGVKIMTILHSDSINDEIAKCPKKDCWEKHAHHGNIDVYVHQTEESPEEREKFRLKAIEKRKDFIFCDEMPKVDDDW